jgi:hypothetical protein
MLTLADQIMGQTARTGGGPAQGAGPQPRGHIQENCFLTNFNGLTSETLVCPTPQSIFKKATFKDPFMQEINGKAYLIVSVWGTGTGLFYGTGDGKTISKKHDGTFRVTTPKRMLVINPRNPRLRSLERAERVLKRAVSFKVKRK